MNSDDIKNLDISEKEFSLIIEALREYPDSKLQKESISNLLSSLFFVRTPEQAKEATRKETIRVDQKRRELEPLRDDITILSSKLIMLKRILIENNLMSQIK
jgi:glycerol-3-phosphate dehydrogenase